MKQVNINYKKLINDLKDLKRSFDYAENSNLRDYGFENPLFVDEFYNMSNKIVDEIDYLESQLEENQKKTA